MLRIFQVMEISKKIYENLRLFEKLLGKFAASIRHIFAQFVKFSII